MTLLDDIIQRARRVDARGLLASSRMVGSILSEERRASSMGGARVEGGLIAIPGGGRAAIVGDIHGDFEALEAILKSVDFLQGKRAEDGDHLVFLGDYGDRGEEQAEVYATILDLKLNLPSNVILLRGNHEGPRDLSFHPHDLPYVLEDRFGSSGAELYGGLRGLWEVLPHAILFEGKYLVLHGGPPSQVGSLGELARAHELHPRKSHLEEVLWSDPRDGVRGVRASPRGLGRLFGDDVTERTLEMVGAKTLIRAHEACYGVMVRHGGKVLTVFSCKKPYGLPRAAFLSIDLSKEGMDAYALSDTATFI